MTDRFGSNKQADYMPLDRVHTKSANVVPVGCGWAENGKSFPLFQCICNITLGPRPHSEAICAFLVLDYFYLTTGSFCYQSGDSSVGRASD